MTTEPEFREIVRKLLQAYTGEPEDVTPTERFWVDQQEWLQSKGYMLRPRYRPGWTPSWVKSKKWFSDFEDAQIRGTGIMDAKRISDGKMVAMKMLWRSTDSAEMEMTERFSSESFSSHPKNHCVRVLDTLEVPGYEGMFLFVLPHLRIFNEPRFETVGEAMDFIRQLLEAVQFLHENHIAHRDIHLYNVMMDPTEMYPDGYHPLSEDMNYKFSGKAKHYSRTERPPKYVLIDFGLTRYYDPQLGPPSEEPILGGNKTVPEFQGEGYNRYYDPFPTDIYYSGELLREHFLRTQKGLHCLHSMIEKMTDPNPKSRPTIGQCIEEFNSLSASLSSWTLRSRVVPRKETSSFWYAPIHWYRSAVHQIRTSIYIIKRLPAVPKVNDQVPTG